MSTLTPKELKEAWNTVVDVYNNTCDGKPIATAKEIVSKLGMDNAMQVFAAVTMIKKHDGRIDPRNRAFMAEIPVDPAATIWDSSNELIYGGLDNIHTSHIDQIMTELIKIKKAS